MFGKSVEEIQSDPDGVMGANHVELADDMLTIQSQPIHVMPSRVKEPPLKSILSLREAQSGSSGAPIISFIPLSRAMSFVMPQALTRTETLPTAEPSFPMAMWAMKAAKIGTG